MITVTYLLDDGSSDWTYSVKKITYCRWMYYKGYERSINDCKSNCVDWNFNIILDFRKRLKNGARLLCK